MSELDAISTSKIGYFSPFVPPEWIEAHSAVPVLLSPQRSRSLIETASTSSRRGVCSCAGDLFDGLLSDTSLQGIVLPTTCDQLRYSAAWLQGRTSTPLFLFNVPSTWRSTSSRLYYADELCRLGRFLQSVTGRESPAPESLLDAMNNYNAIRSDQRKFFENEASTASVGDVRLALVGGPLFENERKELVNGLGKLDARLVLDASEFGERTLAAAFDPNALDSNPFEELVRAYFDVIPDAFRRPDTMLHDWLMQRFRERNVQGVLIRRHVFCDLWNGAASRIRERSGLPTLDLHVGQGEDAAASRTWGRIEAFLECFD
jgi:benzoyl-CoA reductase/2-hydroxyglutaryl-CoA dehydratase subunit BcrC/BadD/HgdB